MTSEGRVAVVTGAWGIGRAVALSLANERARWRSLRSKTGPRDAARNAGTGFGARS